MFKSYINPSENREAKRLLPKLMVEGLLLFTKKIQRAELPDRSLYHGRGYGIQG